LDNAREQTKQPQNASDHSGQDRFEDKQNRADHEQRDDDFHAAILEQRDDAASGITRGAFQQLDTRH
jgi:hypothetical protein